ncbi:TerC/Alx family metal homeostasis membrane protein [Gleimia hominis]|uniref:TerC/Alx family metal homeostasis membrane protein n=1 Tax=Gleimia hominis TaxID=595468 RepID=A0ABU3ICE1_9ACTO|nr:TerC/Alx family metal homeostasis membrane protein [Gleimia hominis]MDT3767601.1 TerC/Alx family metal homeostasis membrane protein [Gleimia hominis]
MDVHLLGWLGLAAVVVALVAVDIFGHVRTPHEPTLKEAAKWSAGYIALALAFGLLIWGIWGLKYAGEYWAGWITEWSLSLDNLFVFIIIIGAFRVPRAFQQKVLLSGIIIALVLRLVFILIGGAIIARWAWIFYIFGLWLLYTAYTQVRDGLQDDEADAEYTEPKFVTLMRKVFPVTDGFVSDKLLHRHAGRTYITPLLLVIVALGSADLMFAFDSIPAIFGLTREPFIVFAANAFALLGLRQLYFLIDGLLEKLVYLHFGLAAILAFIGVKLILHAMHENTFSFLNGGKGFDVPEIGIPGSLGFIIVTLVVTVVASIWKSRKDKSRS